MDEQAVNKFFQGARIEYIFVYDEVVHVQADNGAMLALSVSETDGIDVDILGPDAPEREQMRDRWTDG